MIFIMLQVFASCFAGVYNEYLLKGKGAQVRNSEKYDEIVILYSD